MEELKNKNAVRLSYLSPDGEEGYPGNLKVHVTYTLMIMNEWHIEYVAETDQITPVNLTQHAYFNLNAENIMSVLDHVISIPADGIVEVDERLKPTGQIVPVANTVFDLRKPQKIRDHVAETPQGGGYDQNYVLNFSAEKLKLAATVYEPQTGRKLTV